MLNDDRATRPAGTAASSAAAFAIDLPSDLGLLEAVVSYLITRCLACGFDDPRLDFNFRVSVTEALANAILYGNDGDREKTVRVEVNLDPRRVEVTVIDQGGGFDPHRVPDPTSPDNLEAPGGRGLFLIRHLMDEMSFNERGNVVRMVLVREGPNEPAAGG
jgi:serine/threonine-protein kinase RsbW